jgi:hypothetical protein
MPNVFNQEAPARSQNAFAAQQAEAAIGRVTGQDAGGGLWVQTPDGQEIALPADRINVRDGMAYALPPQEVGLGGKALGALGLDLDGNRGRTSWSEAAHNSTKARGGRGNVLPIDESGLAVPGMLAQPIEDFNAMREYGPDPIRSFSAAGLAPTVGLASGMAGAVPEGAVAANGIGRAASHLPMDETSRMARAKEMGFDTDRTWYHGTNREFDEFDLNAPPRAYDNGAAETHPSWFGKGVYLSGSKEGAMPGAKHHMELSTRLKNPLRVFAPVMGEQEAAIKALYPDFNGFPLGRDQGEAFTEALTRAGYDGVDLMDADPLGLGYFDMRGNKVEEPPVWERVVFDPKNLRRKDAAFDPAQSDSANLLYSNSPTGASVPLLQRLLGQRGGQAAATDTAAIQAEMAALQQRHTELFGAPYRTPQPPGGATPETMAADLAELRGRIQSKEQALAAQPAVSSVPAVAQPVPPPAPFKPELTPGQQAKIAARAAEHEEIQNQIAANPYAQAIKGRKGFVKREELQQNINDYYSRKGEPLGPWKPGPDAPQQYQAVAKAQQDFEAARRDIVTNNQALQKAEQQRTAAVRGAKPNAVRQKDAEIKQLKAENEQLRLLYERLSKIIKPDD